MTPVVHITVEPSLTEKEIVHRPHWIHPQLKESVDLVKGRQLRVAGLILKGTCLLVDRAYAMIPVVDKPAISDSLVCSNTSCHRRTARHARLACGKCIPDVVWCDSACRDADTIRHGFECTWLQRFAGSMRAKRGEYDFGVLWLIVRLLAMRHVEMQRPRPRENNDVVKPVMASPLNSHEWKCGWEGIESLCGSSDTWSHEQVRAWSVLVKKYLASTPVLPHGLSADRVLHIICQEEANSFGLYPRETGVVPDPPIDRGEQFAAAVYPTAAIANHSCVPNIIHKPDEAGRMVFIASREIAPGEECCISYFDLTRFTDLESRREHLRKSFRFVCRCERCLSEEPEAETFEWSAMPMEI